MESGLDIGSRNKPITIGYDGRDLGCAAIPWNCDLGSPDSAVEHRRCRNNDNGLLNRSVVQSRRGHPGVLATNL